MREPLTFHGLDPVFTFMSSCLCHHVHVIMFMFFSLTCDSLSPFMGLGQRTHTREKVVVCVSLTYMQEQLTFHGPGLAFAQG